MHFTVSSLKCDIFNKQEIFHYENEILKENSLYLCLTNI